MCHFNHYSLYYYNYFNIYLFYFLIRYKRAILRSVSFQCLWLTLKDHYLQLFGLASYYMLVWAHLVNAFLQLVWRRRLL